MAPTRKQPGRVSQARKAAGAATGAPPPEPLRLPRGPKGRRAQFYADPAVDQLMAIVVALTAEVSVAFDRIETLERLLAGAGVIAPGAVEGYVADDAENTERNRRREALIERVFQVLSQYPPR